MPIFNELIFLFWLIFIVYWFFSAFGVKKNLRSNTWLISVGFRLLLFVVILSLFRTIGYDSLMYHYREIFFNPIIGSIGVLLCGGGITFAIWARVYLGKNWGMPMSVKEKPELVIGGPYAYVRHPIYTGVLLAMLGSLLVSGLWWSIFFIVFF